MAGFESLSDRDFRRVARLIGERTGIMLNESKRELVYGRLSRRLRALSLNRFDVYLDRLEQGDDAELEEFVNALTTNLTAFFREPHHFEMLEGSVLEEMRRANPDGPLKIWSAGCSTGEEPWSIAMTLADAAGSTDAARILATDVDSRVVAHADAGIYDASRITGIARERQRRWLLRGKGAQDGKVRIRDDLRSMARFQKLNLFDEWPIRGPLDAIFCRNTLIYFDKPTQKELVKRFSTILRPGGYLFIGHSESLYKVTDTFRLLDKTLYRKTPP
ncbi:MULTISPECIES: protein-glutamate O-methyltransferase CheR [unclassified Thioalkalivibrio]|uniref:CheR family methyltransferase n=1 Tax=unclassified Thioalkalivibrio TaxID=2621013 RepID=UPI00036045C5|nr:MULTISPECIES: protein-glutamate O-methyltransferase CheR [unclassified Thioalkalivibrio]